MKQYKKQLSLIKKKKWVLLRRAHVFVRWICCPTYKVPGIRPCLMVPGLRSRLWVPSPRCGSRVLVPVCGSRVPGPTYRSRFPPMGPESRVPDVRWSVLGPGSHGLTQVFFCEYCEILKNFYGKFFTGNLQCQLLTFAKKLLYKALYERNSDPLLS